MCFKKFFKHCNKLHKSSFLKKYFKQYVKRFGDILFNSVKKHHIMDCDKTVKMNCLTGIYGI